MLQQESSHTSVFGLADAAGSVSFTNAVCFDSSGKVFALKAIRGCNIFIDHYCKECFDKGQDKVNLVPDMLRIKPGNSCSMASMAVLPVQWHGMI